MGKSNVTIKAVCDKPAYYEDLEEQGGLIKLPCKVGDTVYDGINNPLEPLKLGKTLESEIFKCNYRKEHKPQDINMLDFTVIYALKYCLEEVLKESEE